jgi:pimeloyl-ACP methyl ester carboxylesterase
MKHIVAGALEIAYLETGPTDGPPVIMMHGFPYDAHAFDEAAALLAAAGRRCIVPFLRGYGTTRFLSAETFRSGQQAALGSDLKALMDALGIRTAVLGGYDWGGRAACVAATLWPNRVSGLVTCGTAYNLQNCNTLRTPLSPETERRHWYWFYLNSERGAKALADDRRGLCRFLWKGFSPTWDFSGDVFDRSAAAFENPDFVDVVLHSYRYRIGAVPGDPALEALEQRLATQPPIAVPTVALSGADDGVDPPKPAGEIAPHFTQLRRLTILTGIGHNLPQEAPDAFVHAVLELKG